MLGKTQSSPSGNRTLVSRVTGGDTDHYTNEDLLGNETFLQIKFKAIVYLFRER